MRTLPVLMLVLLPLAGCVEDGPTAQGPEAPPAVTDEQDIPSMPTPTALEHLATLDAGPSYGIWLEPPLLLLTSPQDGLRIVDVSDPTEPRLIASDIPDSGGRDVEVLHHPDGRDYAVVGRLREGVAVFDITEPRDVRTVAQIPTTGDGHNIAIVPGTQFVWVAHSVANEYPGARTQGYFEIIDLADPASPKVKEVPFPLAFTTASGAPWSGHAVSCHHFDFSPERNLGFCAAVTDFFILDASDPWDPVFLQVVPADGNQLYHAAWSARNGTLLILGDEGTGAVVDSPLCSDVVDVPTSTLWFYDISDLARPVPAGHFALPYDAVGRTVDEVLAGEDAYYCSAHLGRVVPGQDILTVGWYQAGTVIVDFSDLGAIRHVHAHEQGGKVWEAASYGDLVATGNYHHGTDLYRVV